MKSLLMVVLVLTNTTLAMASNCVLTIRQTGPDVMDEGISKSFEFESTGDYKFFQEYYGDFFFQLSTETDGPADGRVGQAKSIGLMISSSKSIAESTATYLPNIQEGTVSLVVPNSDGKTGTLASMSCTDI